MTEIQLLTHEELIAPTRRFKRILLPDEIPLHPFIFKSDLVYSREFLDEVRRALPVSVSEDVTQIEKMLGKSPEIQVTETGVANKLPHALEYAFSDFSFHAKNNRQVDVAYGSANIGMDAQENRRIFREVEDLENHPMSLEKLKNYGIQDDDKIKNIFWYVHNVHGYGMPAELIFRNFAILFNNLGLARLQEK